MPIKLIVLMILALTLTLLVCLLGRHRDKEPFIPLFAAGIYVSATDEPYCGAWDTVVVSPMDHASHSYVIRRRVTLQCSLGDTLLQSNQLEGRWVGLFVPWSGFLSGMGVGPDIQVLPGNTGLRMEGRPYTKIE